MSDSILSTLGSIAVQDDHVAFDALRDGHGLGNRSRHVLHFIKHAGTVSRLDSDNPPIGLFADLSQTCTMLQTPFLPGDRLVLYTDGITESIRDFRFACPRWHLYTPESRRAHEILFGAQSSSSRGRHLRLCQLDYRAGSSRPGYVRSSASVSRHTSPSPIRQTPAFGAGDGESSGRPRRLRRTPRRSWSREQVSPCAAFHQTRGDRQSAGL